MSKPSLQTSAFKLHFSQHLTCYTPLVERNYRCLGTLLLPGVGCRCSSRFPEDIPMPVPGSPARCLPLMPRVQQLSAAPASSTSKMLKKHIIKPSRKQTIIKKPPFCAHN